MADELAKQLAFGLTVKGMDGKDYVCRPFTVRQVMYFDPLLAAYWEAAAPNGENKPKDPLRASELLMQFAKEFPKAVGCEELADAINPADIPELMPRFYFRRTAAVVVRAVEPPDGDSPTTTSSPSSPPPATDPTPT